MVKWVSCDSLFFMLIKKSNLVQLYFALRHITLYFRKLIIQIISHDIGGFNTYKPYLSDIALSIGKLGWGKVRYDEILERPAKLNSLIERADELLTKQVELEEISKDITLSKKKFKVNVTELFNRADLLDVIKDKNIIEVARSYLKITPYTRQAEVWWDHSLKEDERDSQTYHVDGDDPLMLKVFFYLTTVNEEDGPFTYIEKSHRLIKQFILICKYGLAGISESAFSSTELSMKRQCLGKPGDVFFADTNGFHKGLKPSDASPGRIILMLQFGSRWPTSEKHVSSLIPFTSCNDLSS